MHVEDSCIFISPSGGYNEKIFHPKSFVRDEDSTVKFYYVGRIVKDKGWDTMLKAFSMLKKEMSNVRLYISGGGEKFADMQMVIRDLNLEADVHLTGMVSQKEMNHFFNKIDVVLFTSRIETESLGLAAIEALATATPVIANYNGAIPELIADGVNGFLYRDDNEEELLFKMKQFIELNQDERKCMNKAALSSVQKFKSDIVASDLNEVIYNIVKSNEKR